MKVKLRFIPKTVANYFDMNENSYLEVPEGSRYRDLVSHLEKRFRETSRKLGHAGDQAFPDSFIILSDGESVAFKLDEPVRPGEEISIIMMAVGG